MSTTHTSPRNTSKPQANEDKALLDYIIRRAIEFSMAEARAHQRKTPSALRR